MLLYLYLDQRCTCGEPIQRNLQLQLQPLHNPSQDIQILVFLKMLKLYDLSFQSLEGSKYKLLGDQKTKINVDTIPGLHLSELQKMLFQNFYPLTTS